MWSANDRMGEIAGNATRGRGEDAWRLEPKGEAETPETKVVSHDVEGVHVDSNGEGRSKFKNPEGKVTGRRRR